MALFVKNSNTSLPNVKNAARRELSQVRPLDKMNALSTVAMTIHKDKIGEVKNKYRLDSNASLTIRSQLSINCASSQERSPYHNSSSSKRGQPEPRNLTTMPNLPASDFKDDEATLKILERQGTHSRQSLNKLTERMMRRNLAKINKAPGKSSPLSSLNLS